MFSTSLVFSVEVADPYRAFFFFPLRKTHHQRDVLLICFAADMLLACFTTGADTLYVLGCRPLPRIAGQDAQPACRVLPGINIKSQTLNPKP
jgi:hypothetical protein